MKKLLAIIFTLFLAYITAYYTTGAQEKQEPFDFENNQIFYKIMCFVSGETDTTDASALFTRGDDHYYFGDYELAISDYERSFEIDSTKGYAMSRIADCYLALNDTLAGISVLEEYVIIALYKDEVLNKLAEIYLAKGDLKKAKRRLREAAKINEFNDMVQANLYNVYIRKKSYDKALKHITNAININGENTGYINNRRRLYLKLNQADLANIDYNRLLEIDPSFFPDYAAKAKTAKENGETQSAIEYYKLALEFDPGNKDMLNSRGWLYEEIQQYDSAFYDFDTIVKLYPDYYSYFNRAYLHDRLGRIEKAVEDYSASIKHKDDYYLSYNNRGYEYYKLENYELAEKDYTKSIELKGDYYLNHLNRGLLLYKTKRYEEAIADYKIALQYSANNTIIIYDLALAYDELNNAEKAIDYFNEYLRLEGDEDTTTYKYILERIAILSNQ
ncbi:MAG: hypothetical protein B6I20_02240 [Bacteroidetes bacterium 4572_117]|nr:MAG: hypothetical protein B6I20_02240 [Bacteroidetes bacterium 4572_117]